MPICPLGIAGFAQARALSTAFNDQPEKASRPYDKDRDGFVMGEGAGVVVLEEYEHAKARGAKIYAEADRLWPVGRRLSRHGAASRRLGRVPLDGDGDEEVRAWRLADIDYINAHGTSTPLGDELELGAVRRLFGRPDRPMSRMSVDQIGDRPSAGRGAGRSRRSSRILAMRDQIVPPTLNLDNPSEGCAGVDLVPHVAKKRQVRAVLNNSFGFGGTNAASSSRRGGSDHTMRNGCCSPDGGCSWSLQ